MSVPRYLFVFGELSPVFTASNSPTPDDLKRLKMRFYGLGGSVMQKMGVGVSILPSGEIFYDNAATAYRLNISEL